MTTRFPTSLSRAPSTPTSEEAEARLHAFECRLWREHRAVVIKLDDWRVPQGLRDLVEAVGIGRFEKV